MTQAKRVRLCLCCGTVTATPSIPACWEDWQLLPEELRSSSIKTAARGQLILYAKALTEAVIVWRKAGAWRPKRHAAKATAALPLPALQRLLFSAYRQETNELGRVRDVAAEGRVRHHHPRRATTPATKPAAAKHGLDMAVVGDRLMALAPLVIRCRPKASYTLRHCVHSLYAVIIARRYSIRAGLIAPSASSNPSNEAALAS